MRLNHIAVCSLWRRCSIQRRSRWCLRGSIQPSWRGLNGKLLYQLDYADVQERFEERDIRGGEPFWLAVRGNLERLSDAEDWWNVVSEDIKPVAEDT